MRVVVEPHHFLVFGRIRRTIAVLELVRPARELPRALLKFEKKTKKKQLEFFFFGNNNKPRGSG
jgi:hypothetical protein